jgi:hypothetical protein
MKSRRAKVWPRAAVWYGSTGARAGWARPGVRAYRGAARGSTDSHGASRACPYREARSLGMRDLGQRIAPGGAGRRYGAARARPALWSARRHGTATKLIQLSMFEMEKFQKFE